MTTNGTRKKQKREAAWEDSIVAEVRAVRDRLAASFDYDIGRIVGQFIAQQAPQPKTTGKRKGQSTSARAKAE